MKLKELIPPTGYKGGKRRLAPQIVDMIMSEEPSRVYDLCSGSGAVSLEIINRGFPVECITMVEAGPWGMFYASAAEGGLNLGYLRSLLRDEIPKDPRAVREWVENDIALRDPGAEEFLVLQAASYGSTPVWHDGERWRRGDASANRGYRARSYWEPGPGSKETKPRGTIFRPDRIILAAEAIDVACRRLNVVWGEVAGCSLEAGNAVTYIDPPYAEDTGYGWTLDLMAAIDSAPGPVFVSEGRPLEGAVQTIRLGSRRGSAVSHGSKRREEWVSVFR